MTVNLPTSLLRSFVTIVDAGTMMNAAEKVFISQSALSLQIKRLEELVQQPLFQRDGRRLVLNERGHRLLSYARRMLSIHDEALQVMTDELTAGPIRIGTVQDFADVLLTGLLARFASLHPDCQIFARVAGTAELQSMLMKDDLDMLVGYAAADDPNALSVAKTAWYGDPILTQRDVIPLVVLEKPCRFREAATTALEGAGLAWRIAVETPNLSTLRAAVGAGLGITCRTSFFADKDDEVISGLPALPDVACIVSRPAHLAPHKARLVSLAAEMIQALDREEDTVEADEAIDWKIAQVH